MAQSKRKVSHWRYYLVAGVFLSLTLLIMYRAFQLQIWDRHFLVTEGDKRAIRYSAISAHRGMILDRNGEPLAVSTPVVSIWANPSELIAENQHLSRLAEQLHVKLSTLQAKLKHNQKREFIYLKRQMNPPQAKLVLALHVPGVYGVDEYKRYYPAGEIASHMVGFTDIDDKGQEGLELAFDNWLRGEPGQVRLVKDLRGYLVRSAEVIKSVNPGKTLQLSLDLRIQYRAYYALKKAVTELQAQSGSIVILDVRTGEVLAMVNQPSYNPNNRSALRPAAMRNRAMTDTFEPGSSIKPLTIAAALETGSFTPETPIDTSPGWMRLGRYEVKDVRNFGLLNVASVIQKSSNVGVSKIILSVGVDVVRKMFLAAGLGQPSGTGFPGENAGYLPSHYKWQPIQAANFSFGYGLAVSALQLASAESALATGGMRYPVSLLKRATPPQGKRIMSQAAARQVADMMMQVVRKGGTGVRAAIPGYDVAGKTGTVRLAKAGGYSETEHRALFVGFAPARTPRLLAVVTINTPSTGRYYGGVVAAPVFAKVMGDALRFLNVWPKRFQQEKKKGFDWKTVAEKGDIF